MLVSQQGLHHIPCRSISRKSICWTAAGYSSVASGGRLRGVALIEEGMNDVAVEELVVL